MKEVFKSILLLALIAVGFLWLAGLKPFEHRTLPGFLKTVDFNDILDDQAMTQEEKILNLPPPYVPKDGSEALPPYLRR